VTSDGERIHALERDLDQMRFAIDRLSVRETTSMPHKQVRLARTSAGPGIYPSSGDTFYIDFLDGQYTKAAGSQSPVYIDRHGTAFELCHNMARTLPPENTLLHVWEWDGYWWTEYRGPEEGVQGVEEIAVVQICLIETNECCVFSGKVIKLMADTNTCDQDRCAQEIWVTCENRELLPDFDYQSASPPISHAYGGFFEDFCDFGRNSGKLVDCGGDERELWVIPCPCKECECPDITKKARVEYVGPGTTGDGTLNCSFADFDMECVDEDPITGIASPGGTQYWWGEFSITGKYPKMGFPFGINPGDEFVFLGETIDTVYIAWGGAGDADDSCDSDNLEAWVNINGTFHQYNGTFTLEDPPPPLGAAVDITLGPQCVILDSRTFYYGMLASCVDPNDTIEPVVLYHLPGGTQDPARVADGCAGLMTPDGNVDFPDPNGAISTIGSGDCCGVGGIFTIDATFGNGLICSPISHPNDLAGVDLNFKPFLYHVFGGCVDFLQSVFGTGATPELDTCTGNEFHGDARFTILWDAHDKPCEPDDV